MFETKPTPKPRNFLTICTWHKSILCRCTDMFHNRRMTDFPKEMLIFQVTPHGPKIPSWVVFSMVGFNQPFWQIPGSSIYVKFMPFGRFFGWKGTNFTRLEDPGMRKSKLGSNFNFRKNFSGVKNLKKKIFELKPPPWFKAFTEDEYISSCIKINKRSGTPPQDGRRS